MTDVPIAMAYFFCSTIFFFILSDEVGLIYKKA